ncbi:MAG: nucleotidyltransferase domain-containing protein [Candidatus Helarchaeota archaeon]
MLKYYEIIKELHSDWKKKFDKFIMEFKDKKACIILFGSRFKGNDNLLSDYDLLILVIDNEDKKEIKFIIKNIDFPADIFFIFSRRMFTRD